MDREALKRAAAARAIEEIEDGMVVGLGSGSTAEIAVELLAGAPACESSAYRRRSARRSLRATLGMALATLDEHPHLDLVIDGADQVERGTLNLVKGLGGALLREKIVASAGAPHDRDGRRQQAGRPAGRPYAAAGGDRRLSAGARRSTGWSGQASARPCAAAPSTRS